MSSLAGYIKALMNSGHSLESATGLAVDDSYKTPATPSCDFRCVIYIAFFS